MPIELRSESVSKVSFYIGIQNWLDMRQTGRVCLISPLFT
jgi:hypothetical protein